MSLSKSFDTQLILNLQIPIIIENCEIQIS